MARLDDFKGSEASPGANTHTISHAKILKSGNARYAPVLKSLRGVPFSPLLHVSLGTPVVSDQDALVLQATGAELPNNETVTYTFPGSASPIDGVRADGILDVPRTIRVETTHGSAVVAMTLVVTGTDEYGEVVREQIEVAAGGTSQSDVGLKAFKTITSISITSAGNAETNTLDVGFTDALGLPVRVDAGGLVMAQADSTLDLTSSAVLGTFVPAVTSAATATTGDVRGTYDPVATLNGSIEIRLLVKVADVDSKEGAYGVAQFGG